MNVTWEQSLIALDKSTILWVIGTIIAIITAIGVFEGPIKAQKRQEKKDSLKKHFNDFQNSALKPIHKVTSNVYARSGYILNHHWESIEQLNAEQFVCFRAHYPVLADEWLAKSRYSNNLGTQETPP